MGEIKVKVGDYGYTLFFFVKHKNGTAFNLTGYTITFIVWASGVPETPIVEGECYPVSATAGSCGYEVEDGDFDTVGTYDYELEMTKAGVVESTDTGTLKVVESPFPVA